MLLKTSLCMVIFQMLIIFRWSQTEKETAKIKISTMHSKNA